MLTHEKIWQAIDDLAQMNKLSASGLARKAGLDPTSFNKSKRQTPSGRLRWPSTESIAKALVATSTSLDHFVGLVTGEETGAASGQPGFAENASKTGFNGNYRSLDHSQGHQVFSLSDEGGNGFVFDTEGSQGIPLIGFAQAGSGGYFDNSGFPTGQGWDLVDFPKSGHDSVYALEVSGDSMLPLYREGDVLVISPGATVRTGDRVVVKTREGEVMAKILARKTSQSIEFHSLNPQHEDRIFAPLDIEWTARILWASQ